MLIEKRNALKCASVGEITIGDKSLTEKVKLIALLDEDEKNVVFKMIDAFLTKKKFKEFFEQQLAS
ncbi:hypothetical protein [Microscilla marina]|uniref:hypothetical protein n=1 Tax=Microscilla marina TaxID=1027 RepID=UPI0005D47D40|nr:hypothetical protein [Microscilla marina]